MAARQNKNQPRASNHNRIARAVFAAAESTGITDRKLLEELTSQVIQRLESRPALPGMEHLVPRQEKEQTPSASKIDVAVKEIRKKIARDRSLRHRMKCSDVSPSTLPRLNLSTTPRQTLPIGRKGFISLCHLWNSCPIPQP